MSQYKFSVIKDTKIITEIGKIVISFCLQKDIVMWYHNYLQHPGMPRLEKILRATMTWYGLCKEIRRHIELCLSCQKNKRSKIKYGKVPTKIAWTVS